MAESQIKRPSLWLFFTEIFRALNELRKCWFYVRRFRVKYPGDGHTVLVVPGFMASDFSTMLLRNFLRRHGYKVHGWGLGTNYADLHQLDVVDQRIDALYQKSGQPISLIGWSLGGVYVRELAKKQPEKIRQVITLGSPYGGIFEPNNANITFKVISWLKKYPEPDPSFINQLPRPVPVPTTAFYSKKDGIVPWEACIEPENGSHQNIEVASSHLGMGVYCEVLEIIARQLTYDRSNWRPFLAEDAPVRSSTSNYSPA